MLMPARRNQRGRKASPWGGGSGGGHMMAETGNQKPAPLAATISTGLAALRGFFMQKGANASNETRKGNQMDRKQFKELRDEISLLQTYVADVYYQNDVATRGSLGAKIAIVQNKTMKFLKAAKAADTEE